MNQELVEEREMFLINAGIIMISPAAVSLFMALIEREDKAMGKEREKDK